MLSGDAATILLDSRVFRGLSPHDATPEPEPSPGLMEGTTTPEVGPEQPEMWQPEPMEIPEAKFKFYNRPYNRPDRSLPKSGNMAPCCESPQS